MKQLLLQEAVKTILCQMAIDCSLPSDMTQLDIATVFEKAEKSLENDDQYRKVCAIDKLGNFVSEDDVIEAYEKLLEQAEIDDQVQADDVVCMWEPLEDRYTVSQLLDEIS